MSGVDKMVPVIRVTKMFRPRKQQVSLRLDADLLAWLKSPGKGYHSRINAILRKAMQEEEAGK